MEVLAIVTTNPPDYSFQQRTHDHICRWMAGDHPCLLISSPTGTGKTRMQSRVLSEFPSGVLIAPTEEILDGFRRLGVPDSQLWTVQKLLNQLAKGTIDPTAWSYYIVDEAHHTADNRHQLLDESLGRLRRLGFTATTYRGTPAGTAALHDLWAHNIYVATTIPEAVAAGVMSLPEFKVVPLVDDETISITGGEFTVNKVAAATREKLADLADLIAKHWKEKPTMVALSSVDLVHRLAELLTERGVPNDPVTMETRDRQPIFDRCQRGESVMIQIAVVGEGVDLPGIRRLIDARPTMSPVFWMQLVGRICRPGPIPSEVWVCNHNLLRHAYLFEGAIPRGVVAKAAKAWGKDWKPSRRMVGRAIGIDGVGKFQPALVPLVDGSHCLFFVLGSKTIQYCCLLDPAVGTPKFWAVRDFELDENGNRRYDRNPRWRRIDCPPDLKGFTSVPAKPLSPGQQDWWKTSARWKNLDPDAQIDARTFQILPVLKDLNMKVKL